MRRLAIFALLLAAVLTLSAQTLSVKGFRPVGDVLHGKQLRQDVNGAEAAVVKVLLPVPGASFDGNLIGEPEYYGSEYWVWLEGDAAGSGTSMFDVRCPGAPTLRVDFSDFGIPQLKSKGVYELTLDVPRDILYGRAAGPADLGGDYLMLSVTPKENVVVRIDGVLKATRDGELSEFLSYGDHHYSVEAPGYIADSGTITVSRNGGKVKRSVVLRSAMGTLTVKAETPGTKIALNGRQRGVDSWSGPLVAGNYSLEATLDGHRPYTTAFVMPEGENRTVTIPALSPVYAVLQVDYYPHDSRVIIDGKSVGTTPLALNNLTAGVHTLEIAADGYQPHRRQITLTENTPLRIAGELTANTVRTPTASSSHTLAEADRYYDNKEYAKAAPIYLQFAEQGNARAQFFIGWMYSTGNGVAQSYAEAVTWYRKGAEQGNADAQCSLGVRYANGQGVAQSYAEAVKWYRKSAEQGNADAQCNLGLCYANGNGVAQSYAEAVKWYRKSAEQGNARAQCSLGNCYWNGNGVTQNNDEAVRLWRLAAKQGQQNAKNNLKKFGYSE